MNAVWNLPMLERPPCVTWQIKPLEAKKRGIIISLTMHVVWHAVLDAFLAKLYLRLLRALFCNKKNEVRFHRFTYDVINKNTHFVTAFITCLSAAV